MADVLAASKASDWRVPDPENVLYLDLAGGGRVVIELAPEFAPKHVANIKVLARGHYFDGLSFMRSQDNYVVQWGDPSESKSLGKARASLFAELARPSGGVPFTPLPDGDVYAAEVGFSNGFPTARDPQLELAWLTHCYGMVGVGRNDALDSGNGSELYVVTGHSPRHLDRNVTLVGRVLQGIDLLSVLPRGKGALGFYEAPQQPIAFNSITVAADVPEKDRVQLEVLRTDTPTFEALVQSRRFRRESWFKNPVGKIELCNVPLPVRPRVPG
jgi:peptidylprolyl isomerase